MAGSYHKYIVECTATGLEGGCCVESECNIEFSTKDRFIDPLDLHEDYGFSEEGIIANVGGNPFYFGLKCDSFSFAQTCNKE